MKDKGFASIAIVIVAIGAAIIFIFNQQTKKLAQQDNRANTPNLLTQDNEFINKKYNYKITYSDIFEITTTNPETAASVNFRKKDDITPAESGVSIKVLESTSKLKDVCGTPFLENQGILCNKDNFKFTPLLDDLPWEIYGEDAIGIVPSGYIYASMFTNGNIYLINNYGYKSIEADMLMDNFEFIK